MRRSSFGKLAIGLAVFAGILFALHYTNVIPVLNTVFPALVTIFGTLLGILGYFERDKQKLPALIGILLNAALLSWWIGLLVIYLSR
ncbi:MAG: hypothetical protein RLZZ519_435 [Bacteroidota bacterium]|jgi:hypothetical protein